MPSTPLMARARTRAAVRPAITALAAALTAAVTVGAPLAGAPAHAADPTVPSAPTAVTARAGVNQAKVYFAAPASDGGAAVTTYTATSVPEGKTCTATAAQTACKITGLTNGQAYTFNVTATNAVGTSPAATTNAVTPATDTTAPVLVSSEVTPDRVSSLGGETVTVRLRITDDLSGRAAPSGSLDANPAVLFSHRTSDATFGFTRGMRLTSGDEYDGTYTVTVPVPAGTPAGDWDLTVYPIRDAAGNSTFFTDRPGIVVGAPKAPTSVTATLNTTTPERDVTITWAAPADNGGNVITGYRIANSHNQSTQTVTGTTHTATFPDIAATEAVTFTVTAINAAGTSSPSAPSAPITIPANAPSAPRAVTAVRGNTQATVTWQAPAATNGSPVTGYTITATPANTTVTTGPEATTTTVTGLTNGTSYTFTVTATNAAGTSAAATSGPVTPAATPTAPTAVTAIAGDRSAAVSWQAPAANGAALTGYTVTATPGGATVTTGPEATTATVPGLTNGTSYEFTVTATNAVGPSAASAPSLPVTPAAAPLVVTGLRAVRGDRSLTLQWSPANPNGSAVTGYVVTVNGVATTYPATTTTATLTGLRNGTTYQVQVAATNAYGLGAPSVAATAVPAGKPATVAKPAVRVKGRTVTVTWKAPATNGASISGYVITGAKPATKTVAGSVRKATFTLKPGIYKIRVAARNSVGLGAPSAPATVTVRR